MKWGWLRFGAKAAGRILAEREIARLLAENDALRERANYWQARAEALIDQITVKAGHTPVMVASNHVGDPVAPVFRGLTVSEIRTSPKKEATA